MLKDSASTYVLDRYKDQPFEVQLAEAQKYFDKKKRDRDRMINAHSLRLRKLIDEGGLAFADGDVILSEDQQKAILEKRPWKYNRQQAIREYLKENIGDMSTDDVIQVLMEGHDDWAGEGPPPEHLARLQELASREWEGLPGQKSGWIGKLMELVGVGGAAGSQGVAEGVKKAQEFTADKPITPDTSETLFGFDIPQGLREGVGDVVGMASRSVPDLFTQQEDESALPTALIRKAGTTALGMMGPAGLLAGQAIDALGDQKGKTREESHAAGEAVSEAVQSVIPERVEVTKEDAWEVARDQFRKATTLPLMGGIGDKLWGPDESATYKGVPLKGLGEVIADDPKKALDIAGAALGGVYDTVTSAANVLPGPSFYETGRINYDVREKVVADTLREGERRLKSAAIEAAMKELGPDAADEAVVERAQTLYDRMKGDDLTMSWDPSTQMFLEEIIFDPSTYLGAPANPVFQGGRLIKGGFKRAGAAIRRYHDLAEVAKKSGNRMGPVLRASQAATKAFDRTREMFAWIPEYINLNLGQQVADELTTGKAIAETARKNILPKVNLHLKALQALDADMAKLVKTNPEILNPARQALVEAGEMTAEEAAIGQAKADLWFLWEKKKSREEVIELGKEHLLPYMAAQYELEKIHRTMMTEARLWHRFNSDDVLVKNKALERSAETGKPMGYIPRKVRATDAVDELDDVTYKMHPSSVPIDASQSSAARHRSKKAKKDWKIDPYAQWSEAFRENIPKWEKGIESVEINAALERHGLISEIDVADPVELLKAKEFIEKSRLKGDDWTLVRPDVQKGAMANHLMKLRGEAAGKEHKKLLRMVKRHPPGGAPPFAVEETAGVARAGTKAYLLPTPVAKRLETLQVTNRVQKKTYGDHLKALNKHINRPINRFWRGSRTLTSMPYYFKNAMGGFGLATLAHGTRAFDPKLQKTAIQAALMSGHWDDEALRSIKWVTNKGHETTLGAVLDSAARVGVVDISDARIGLGLEKANFLDAAVAKAERIYDIGGPISPKNLNRMIDNYQHLVAYLGFLDDLSPGGIARATALTAQFAGDYKRLSKFEKEVLREGFGFYSWYRFIFPHVLNQTLESPHVMANWARFKDYLGSQYGEAGPAFAEGMPKWSRNFGFPAPWSAQGREEGTAMNLEDHANQFSIAIMEDPWYMGYSLAPALTSFMGSRSPSDQALADLLGPLPSHAVTFLLTGKDSKTGRPVPGWLPYGVLDDTTGGEKWEAIKASGMGQLGYGMIDRPYESLENIWRLYAQNGPPGVADDLAMRIKAGRDWMGLDHVAAKGIELTLGKDSGMYFEPRSLGGPFQTGLPFTTYLAKPSEEAYYETKAAEDAAGVYR
jgi:hypothetical protein